MRTQTSSGDWQLERFITHRFDVISCSQITDAGVLNICLLAFLVAQHYVNSSGLWCKYVSSVMAVFTFLENWRPWFSLKSKILALFVCVLGLLFQERAIEHHKYQITCIRSFCPWRPPILEPMTSVGLEPRVSGIIAKLNFNVICKERTELLSAQLLTSFFPCLLLSWVCVFKWGHKLDGFQVKCAGVLLALLPGGLLNFDWVLWLQTNLASVLFSRNIKVPQTLLETNF